MRNLAFSLFLFALAATAVRATQVQLVVGKASAPVNAVLADGEKFSTGADSKSQVGLKKGFFRVGSETGVQVVTSNHLSLEKGIMLAGSNPGRLWRSPVTVNAPGYKMEVRGTVQVAYYPGHYIKITVLEGRVRVGLQSLTGEWETLEAGKMLIINPSDKRLPEPVEVDIGRLAATSKLIGGAFGELSTQGLIDASAAAQGNGLATGKLALTPLELRGASPELSLVQGTRPTVQTAAVAEATVFQVTNDLVNPRAVVTQATFADNVAQSSFTGLIDRSQQQTQARANTWLVNMDGAGGPAVLYDTITADPTMFAGSPQKLWFDSASGPLDAQGAQISTPPGVALQLTGNGLTLEPNSGTASTLTAGTAGKAGENLVLGGLFGSDVSVTGSVLNGDKVSIASSPGTAPAKRPRVTLDSSTVTGEHGVNIGKSSVRADILIRNSSQLLALASNLEVLANGGSIEFSGTGKTQQAGKTLTIDAMGDGASGETGLVHLIDSQMSAPVIRVRSFGAQGDSMVIDGGAYNATQLIQLFAEGASTLRFMHNVVLNGKVVNLKGAVVTVDAGGMVRINGVGTVYAPVNGRLFNTAGYGSIATNDPNKPLILKTVGKAPKF